MTSSPRFLPNSLNLKFHNLEVSSRGVTINGSFAVINIGDPTSELDWEIVEWPKFGNWSFNPNKGENQTPEDGILVVDVIHKIPDIPWGEWIGVIKVVNKENLSDFEIINIFLSTKVSNSRIKTINNVWNHLLFYSLPIMERLLSLLLD